MSALIGITPSVRVDEKFGEQFTLALTYTGAIHSNGGTPIVLPPQDNASALLDRLDGLLLSGGGDIRPTRYGDQQVHPTTYGISDRRDAFEFALLRGALERGMPILAICRGIQVLNVGLGGSLWQDVSQLGPGTLAHREPLEFATRAAPAHDVMVVEGSLLGKVYGAPTIAANSFHHQVLKDLGTGLLATGHTADGAIEAVELPGYPFVLGVQWHPEMMYEVHPEHAAPFRHLVAAAEVYGGRDARQGIAAD